MASFLYDAGAAELLTGAMDIDGATIKAMLVNDTYAGVAATNEAESVLTTAAADRMGTDYTLLSKTTTAGVFDSADPVWTAVAGGATVTGVVLYRFVSTDANSIPLAYIELTDTAANGGDITVNVDAGGWIALK